MRRIGLAALAAVVVSALAVGAARWAGAAKLGRQPDGGFIVSSGQRIPGGAISFAGRPIDLAHHPTENFLAVLNKNEVFLVDESGVIAGSRAGLPEKSTAGF